MTGFLDVNLGKKSPSLIQLGRRVLLVLGLLTLILIALWMWLSWNNIRQLQLQRMTIAASLAGHHSQSYFDNIGAHLEVLATAIQQRDALNNPKVAITLLHAFKTKHPDLGGASIILPSGLIAFSTALQSGASLPNVLSNAEWRGDFLQNLQATGLSVNKPQHGYILKTWLIPLRYTVRNENGQVQFLIQTSIIMEKQQALWANLGLQPGVNIGILREDGALISTWPLSGKQFDPKQFPANHLSAEIAKNASNGFYREPNVQWRMQREGVYQRMRVYPAYTFLSVPNDFILKLWWRTVQPPIYTFLFLYLLAATVYHFIARRFAQRMLIIQGALTHGNSLTPSHMPSSGVLEIDDLCAALATTQSKLEASAKTREHQLLLAADAGTYTLHLRDGIVLQADDAFLSMLGQRREDVISHAWSALFEDGDSLDAAQSGQHPSQELSLRVLRFKHKNGQPIWLSLAEYIDTAVGEPLRQGLAINVSQREELLAKVQLHSDRLRALWQLATDRETAELDKLRQMLHLGIETLGMETSMLTQAADGTLHVRYKAGLALLFEEGSALPLNDSLCRETLRHKRSQFIDDLAAVNEYATSRMAQQWKLRVYVSAPIWVGDTIYGTLTFYDRRRRQQAFSEEDKVFVELLAAWFGKVLFEQQQRKALEAMAMTDSLTGLSNRRAAESKLSSESARAKRAGETFSLVICDLDRFKLINDHFGHAVGDQVLQHVSAIMRDALREGDWVARWGGEEFMIFLHQSTGQEAVAAMERLRERIKSRPLETQHGKLVLTASFGIGVSHLMSGDILQVLSEADGCLYEAKRSGRDRVVVSETTTRGRLWQAGMLQHALQENRIVAAYQVMVNLSSGEVVADEALARLIQPDGKIIPAAEFVEAAEGINLIHNVDEIIARNALERYSKQTTHGASSGLTHFINLSPQFLARRDLLDALLVDAKNLAQSAGFNLMQHQPIVFEITERQLLEDFDALRENLKHLLEYGFRLALDDFGSGYSSFLYLAELPISYVKIEGWMIRNMQHNDRVLSMVKSVVMLAQTLGVTTIAECVEDARTAEILRDMGVDWGQGYHFGYPVIEKMGVTT